MLADMGGGRLATARSRFLCSVSAKHGKHAPCGMFFMFCRWERAEETGEEVGGYGSQDTHQT